MYEIGNEIAFLIRFGGSLKRDEVMDNDVCRPDIRRPVGYDMVVYNIQSGELRIRAELVANANFIVCCSVNNYSRMQVSLSIVRDST